MRLYNTTYSILFFRESSRQHPHPNMHTYTSTRVLFGSNNVNKIFNLYISYAKVTYQYTV